MTQEQKVRTREEIETEMQTLLVHGVRGPTAAWSDVHRLFDETRSYGATEEREDGAEIAGYILAGTANFFATSKAKYTTTALHRDPSPGYVPVYYSPNVAALEARIAELESYAEDLLITIGTGCISEGAANKLRAALKREGGV